MHPFRGSIDVSRDSLDGIRSDHNAIMNRITINGGNSIMDLSEWRAEIGQGANSRIATPKQLFVDAANADFQLKETSPAIDAGIASHATDFDLAGLPRIVNGLPDIGAISTLMVDSMRWISTSCIKQFVLMERTRCMT